MLTKPNLSLLLYQKSSEMVLLGAGQLHVGGAQPDPLRFAAPAQMRKQFFPKNLAATFSCEESVSRLTEEE